MGEKDKPQSVPADPSKWSEKSRYSLSLHSFKEYTDYVYDCWRCKRKALFSAADQKYTFEVEKAPIDQRRTLCTECSRRLLEIDRDVKLCEQHWAESMKSLRVDVGFLTKWLSLLILREEFVPYRPDTGAQSMLRKLLDEADA